MKECCDALNAKLETEAALLSEKESLVKKESQNKEIAQKEQHVKRQLVLQQEKVDKLIQGQIEKRSLIEASLQSLRMEYDEISKERESIQEKIARNDRLVKDAEAKVGCSL